jgi:hypothetical protein
MDVGTRTDGGFVYSVSLEDQKAKESSSIKFGMYSFMVFAIKASRSLCGYTLLQRSGWLKR